MSLFFVSGLARLRNALFLKNCFVSIVARRARQKVVSQKLSERSSDDVACQKIEFGAGMVTEAFLPVYLAQSRIRVTSVSSATFQTMPQYV